MNRTQRINVDFAEGPAEVISIATAEPKIFPRKEFSILGLFSLRN